MSDGQTIHDFVRRRRHASKPRVADVFSDPRGFDEVETDRVNAMQLETHVGLSTSDASPQGHAADLRRVGVLADHFPDGVLDDTPEPWASTPSLNEDSLPANDTAIPETNGAMPSMGDATNPAASAPGERFEDLRAESGWTGGSLLNQPIGLQAPTSDGVVPGNGESAEDGGPISSRPSQASPTYFSDAASIRRSFERNNFLSQDLPRAAESTPASAGSPAAPGLDGDLRGVSAQLNQAAERLSKAVANGKTLVFLKD